MFKAAAIVQGSNQCPRQQLVSKGNTQAQGHSWCPKQQPLSKAAAIFQGNRSIARQQPMPKAATGLERNSWCPTAGVQGSGHPMVRAGPLHTILITTEQVLSTMYILSTS